MPIIDIDLDRDKLISEQSIQLLKDYYMLPNEKSPQEAFCMAAYAYCYGDTKFAQ